MIAKKNGDHTPTMAGLIPQSFIDDLLSRADIVDVIDKRIALAAARAAMPSALS
jgi:DNA primase